MVLSLQVIINRARSSKVSRSSIKLSLLVWTNSSDMKVVKTYQEYLNQGLKMRWLAASSRCHIKAVAYGMAGTLS